MGVNPTGLYVDYEKIRAVFNPGIAPPLHRQSNLCEVAEDDRPTPTSAGCERRDTTHANGDQFVYMIDIGGITAGVRVDFCAQ